MTPRDHPRPSRYGVALVFLVAGQTFATFLDGNRTQITQPGRVILIGMATGAVCLGFLKVAVRRGDRSDRDRVAVVVASVVACFLGFSNVFDPNPPDSRKLLAILVVWVLLTVLLARLAHLVGGSNNVRLALLVFAALLFIAPTVSYASFRMGGETLAPVADPGPLDPPSPRPNIYWIVLDGYARPDVLADIVGYDDTGFVANLTARGFEVSSSSRASYPRTHLSLASTLDMGYVLEPGDEITDDFDQFGPAVVGNNATVARFRALGYQTLYSPAGGVEWSACRDDLMDLCLPIIRPSPATGELEQTLLDLTPLGLIPLPRPYGTPLTLAHAVTDPSLGIQEPFFAFQHLLTPHHPYRYREDCSARARPLDAHSATPEARLGYYRTQVRCINDLVIDAVDRMVADDPSAVIILQSDHGSDFRFSWEHDAARWTPEQLTERYGAFNAIRLPEDCDTPVEGQPLVNTFRIVFACIEGVEPELLDYRGFAVGLDDVSDVSELAPERFEPG